MLAGASGFVTKGAVGDELVRGIRAVLAGETFVDAALAQEAVKRLVTGMPVNAPASPSTPLSARELDVLRWIV